MDVDEIDKTLFIFMGRIFYVIWVEGRSKRNSSKITGIQ